MVIANKTGSPADVNAVLGMMCLLWEGHRDRHEGGPTTAPITPESAQTAVAIAVTLVHLLATGRSETVLSGRPGTPKRGRPLPNATGGTGQSVSLDGSC